MSGEFVVQYDSYRTMFVSNVLSDIIQKSGEKLAKTWLVVENVVRRKIQSDDFFV